MTVPELRDEHEAALSMLVELLTTPDGSTAGALKAGVMPPVERIFLLGLMTELLTGSAKVIAFNLETEYLDAVALLIKICRDNLAGV
jgi:hypothetical protein